MSYPESKRHRAMRLAHSRLALHRARTERQVRELLKPQGFGTLHDLACQQEAERLREDASVDTVRIAELKEALNSCI